MGERLAQARADFEGLTELLAEIKAARATQTDILAATRGLQTNGCLFAGMVSPDKSGAFHATFQVPFASVAFADPSGLGLLISTTDGEGSSVGPGTLTTGPGDAGCLPLTGTQLSVTPTASAGAFFVAVFARPHPVSYTRGTVAVSSGTLSVSELVDASPGVAVSLPTGSSAVANGAELDGLVVRNYPIAVFNFSAAPTAGAVALEGSIDGAVWYSVATLDPTVAGGVALSGAVPARYARAAITTALASATCEASVAFGEPGPS